MIEKLRLDIKDMEIALKRKKEELKQLLEEDVLLDTKNKLVALIEVRDQFCDITDVLLVDDNETAMKKIQDEYADNDYHHEVMFFRVNLTKQEFKDLKQSLDLDSYGQKILYEWWAKNRDKLIENV